MKLVKSIKDTLEEYVPKLQSKIIVISGYVTIEAFEYLESLMPDSKIEKIILFKLNLLDLANHSTSFNFKKAIENGWKVYVDNSIHAKNYVFDDEIIVQGSFNLTTSSLEFRANTLKDNAVLVDYYDEVENWINYKLSNACLVDNDNLDDLKTFLDIAAQNKDKEFLKLKQNLLEKTILSKTMRISTKTVTSKLCELRTIQVVESFIEAFKESPFKFGEPISLEDIETFYYYMDTEFWQNYIIDLDSDVDIKSFDINNSLYLYTPKIYKIQDKFYIEHIRNEKDVSISEKDITQALLVCFNNNIAVNVDSTNMYVHKNSSENIRIKFKRFYYINKENKGYKDFGEFYNNNLDILSEDGD